MYEVSRSSTDTARAILYLREESRQKVGAWGTTGARLLDYLFVQPIVSVRMAEREPGCAYVTANKLVDQFVELGLLNETTGQHRNRRYRYQPYVALCESPAVDDQ